MLTKGGRIRSGIVRLALAVAVSGGLSACFDEAQISASYRSDRIVPRAQTVTLSDGLRSYVVEGAALLPADGKDSPHPTTTSGDAIVDIVMRDPQGAIATGRLALPLKPDWIWGVELHIDSVNPSRFCFGCIGSRSFPLRAGVGRTSRDSLWVSWGGNYLRDPVVY
jgi:hypothetical protein